SSSSLRSAARASPFLPYTTLFRSFQGLTLRVFMVPEESLGCSTPMPPNTLLSKQRQTLAQPSPWWATAMLRWIVFAYWLRALIRSEEHTSELQSRFDLVCRLLLAK